MFLYSENSLSEYTQLTGVAKNFLAVWQSLVITLLISGKIWSYIPESSLDLAASYITGSTLDSDLAGSENSGSGALLIYRQAEE